MKLILTISTLLIFIASCTKPDLSESCTTPSTIGDSLSAEPGVYIPNSFSPNGDGINDFWIPQGSHICWGRYRIFDDSGENVFEADISIGWDGSVRGMSVIYSDVYYYHVWGAYTDGKEFEYKGPLELFK